ncbi:MAG: hypothetical protein LUG99_00575 [Lachnospiraceae bacterium]|nr:hypothetical protein [Lachnospiraceae bacterium]
MQNKEQKKINKVLTAIRESPINYFSDLLVCAMVVFWIIDNVWESIIASTVTISSIFLSFKMGYNCYDTSMWSSIGSNIAAPLTAGGAVWMIKNAVQHAIANSKGKQAHKDFPKVPDTEDMEFEKEMKKEADPDEAAG